MRASEQEEYIRFLETMLIAKSTTLDRSSDEDLKNYNKLSSLYENILFNKLPKKPKNKKGETLNMDEIIKNKKDLFNPDNSKKFKVTKKSLKGEFKSTDLTDLIKNKK